MGEQATSILLIEDDGDDATMLQLSLDRSPGDYAICRVTDLTQGVEVARSNSHAVIVTDMGLPDSCGLASVDRLCQANPNAAVIVLSGADNEELYVQALAHGADSYLCKHDMTPAILHRCIQQSLHRSRQRNEIRELISASNDQRQQLKEQSVLLASKNASLQQMCKTSQEFVNNVSHEFRTPLCVVKQYASLIADGAVGTVSDEQRKMLNVIEGRVDDLNTIVDDMLDISRHESGLLAASRIECSPTEIVDRILPGLQQRAALRKIELTCEMPATLKNVYCDPEKISRVLINLIVNALKFSSPNEPVVVRVSECLVNREVTFAVCDSGPGIEAEQRDLIFARFQQGDTHLQSSTKGFGLGLSIAKELVDLNLGEMSLQSVVGKGSTFSFTVPMNEPVEIGRRFLKRLQEKNNGPKNEQRSSACVIRATVDKELTVQGKREVHSLLNYLLRSNDLLLQTFEGQWLLILDCHPNELPHFFSRANEEIDLLNRNRPQGPLPVVKMNSLGCINQENLETKLQAFLDPSKDPSEPVLSNRTAQTQIQGCQ